MERMRQIWIAISENKRRMYVAAVVITITAAILLFCRYGEKDELVWDRETATSTSTKPMTETSTKPASGSSNSTKSKSGETIYIDIEGEVKNPGVYTVSRKTRVFEVVKKAGGFTENADPSLINQAEIVEDGEKITVPDKGQNMDTLSSGVDVSGSSMGISTGAASTGRININTAGLEALQQIPGVGPATAQKILNYREQNGRFKKTGDLMNVSGIGEKTFEKMKDCITV